MPSTPLPAYDLVRCFSELHSSHATCAEFSPEGALLATAGADGFLYLIDTADAKVLHAVELGSHIHATCLLWPTHDQLIVGRRDGAVYFLSVDMAQKTVVIIDAVPEYSQVPIRYMSFNSDKQYLAIAYVTSAVVLKRSYLLTGESSWTVISEIAPEITDAGLITSIHFIPKKLSKWEVIVTHAQAGVTVWSLDGSGTFETHKYHSIGSSQVLFNNEGFAVRGIDGGIDFFQFHGASPWIRPRFRYDLRDEADQRIISPLCVLPQNIVATAGQCGTIKLIDVASGREESISCAKSHAVFRGIIAARGAFLAAATAEEGRPSEVRLWETEPAPREAIEEGWSGKTFHIRDLHSAYFRARNRRRRRAPLYQIRRLYRIALPMINSSAIWYIVTVMLVVFVAIALVPPPSSATPETHWKWIPEAIRQHTKIQWNYMWSSATSYLLDRSPFTSMKNVVDTLSKSARSSLQDHPRGEVNEIPEPLSLESPPSV